MCEEHESGPCGFPGTRTTYSEWARVSGVCWSGGKAACPCVLGTLTVLQRLPEHQLSGYQSFSLLLPFGLAGLSHFRLQIPLGLAGLTRSNFSRQVPLGWAGLRSFQPPGTLGTGGIQSFQASGTLGTINSGTQFSRQVRTLGIGFSKMTDTGESLTESPGLYWYSDDL